MIGGSKYFSDQLDSSIAFYLLKKFFGYLVFIRSTCNINYCYFYWFKYMEIFVVCCQKKRIMGPI